MYSMENAERLQFYHIISFNMTIIIILNLHIYISINQDDL